MITLAKRGGSPGWSPQRGAVTIFIMRTGTSHRPSMSPPETRRRCNDLSYTIGSGDFPPWGETDREGGG